MFDRAQLVELAGEAEIGHTNFLGMALPGDGFTEPVELVLVGDAGHIHEALLEGGRGFLKNGVATRLVTHGCDRAGLYARLMGREDRAEEGTKTRARDADALGIELRPRDEPIHDRFADLGPA